MANESSYAPAEADCASNIKDYIKYKQLKQANND